MVPKQWTSRPSANSLVPSVASPSSGQVARWASEHGTTDRSALVVKTTASSASVRTVATSVPAGTRTGSGCGAESQKVTSVRAAVVG